MGHLFHNKIGYKVAAAAAVVGFSFVCYVNVFILDEF